MIGNDFPYTLICSKGKKNIYYYTTYIPPLFIVFEFDNSAIACWGIIESGSLIPPAI